MTFHKFSVCAALMALTLTACDNSLPWDEKTTTGELRLNVSKKEPQHRRGSVDTQDFAVTITGKEEALAKVKREYNKVSDMPESITLPVGMYTVEAHSAGDLLKEMAAPYYKGQKDIEVTNVPTITEVACRMANSKIEITYKDEFLAKYDTWTITINDGTEHVLTFTEDMAKTFAYWWFDQPTKEIRVDITAHTKMGENVTGSAVFTKSQSQEEYPELETEFFTGGDAINVNVVPEVDPNGYLNGITLNADITFANYDEDVIVNVDDEDKPGPGPDPTEDIKITSIPADGIVNALFGQTEGFPQVQYDFEFPTGLKNLWVKVDSDNPTFVFATSLMGLTEGDGLDLTSSAAVELANLFPLPTVGSTTYQFSLSNDIWGLLANSPGYVGTHTFTLKAIDKSGKTKSGQLTIHVNE